MMTLRAFDARMQTAQRQGKTSFYMQHMGEEAVSCAFRRALAPGDMNFPTYRQAGLLIAGGYPMVEMMNQIFSNEADPLKGRQLPIMYSAKDYGFFSISGNLTTQFVQAVGWAMASAIKRDHRIAVGWVGDGATAGIRLSRRAGVRLDLPRAGRAQHRQQPMGDLDLPGHRARRLRHFRRARPRLRPARAARRRQRLSRRPCGRANGRSSGRAPITAPTLIEYVTYRVGAHSTSDDPSAYRPKTESQKWPLGDPVIRLKNHLILRGRLVARSATSRPRRKSSTT